jgi:hypothetical protein
MDDIGGILGGPVLGIGITVVVLGVGLVTYSTMCRPMMKGASATMASAQGLLQAQAAAANLRLTGLPSQARVLGIQPTGTMINMAPECRVDLEVCPPMAAAGYRASPYRVAIMQAIHQVVLLRVQPGMAVPVKIEAGNPLNVVVDV